MSVPITTTISLGDLITFISLLAGAGSILYGFYKDRQLRRREYADRVRHTAGVVIAKLERWVELALRFFQDIQPSIVDVDMKVAQGESAISSRDYFWRELVRARGVGMQRILDEEIELAYADLYGYDPRIHDLFLAAVSRLRAIDERTYARTLEITQDAIVEYSTLDERAKSAELGNQLRATCATAAEVCQHNMNSVVGPFRQEVIRLIQASDRAIVDRAIVIGSAEKLLPPAEDDKPLLIPIDRVRLNRDTAIKVCKPLQPSHWTNADMKELHRSISNALKDRRALPE